MMNRRADEAGRITGVDFKGSKVGGSVDGAILVFPDPMGATGSSLSAALEAYASAGLGTPAKTISVHLVVASEFVVAITAR